MEKRKVAVAELEFGMYVAELDRPWVDSPFLFQGFVIESEQELATLRELCRHVYIHASRVRDDDDDDRTIRRSINVRPIANPERSRAEWLRMASEERRVSFQQEFHRVHAARTHTR